MGHRSDGGTCARAYFSVGSEYWLGLQPYWAMKHRVKYDGVPKPTM